MKGKLIKTDEGFSLCIPHETTNEFIASTDGMYTEHKLSLKNCQAIERGYDLDELAEKHYDVQIKRGHTEEDSLQRKIDFILGVVSALEIIGDKKFSEEDMRKMYDMSCGLIGLGHLSDQTENNERFTSLFQSLKQTEWDVEIIEQCLDPTCDGVNRKGECITTGKPKLDVDGCLILKRIDDE